MKKVDKRNKKKKGFTLIELLAVIVILGLLMAIAIPSVTKYITESRKKTVTTTMGNYISSLVNDVNDLNYTFTETNTIYAVPVECISLERGGTNPFGEWYQSNDSYFAYVLVQYDDDTSSYIYGYTFKDSAGYGLYPITESNLNINGSQIKTGLNIKRPSTGLISTLTEFDNWENSGFKVNPTTELVVLEAESEGIIGDGKETCTLVQKGNNYQQVEEEKKTIPKNLVKLIREHNALIAASPTLTKPSSITGDASGLYVSTETNSGDPTYYFRGDVENNYVSFAGQIWRIVRINEDGTIRLILQNVINKNSYYMFNSQKNNYLYMYYSNSDIVKPAVDNWYDSNLKKYDSYITTGIFCEQAKVKFYSESTAGSEPMTLYTNYSPNFKCDNDSNGMGIVNSKVGLITYDELVYAGGYYSRTNYDYYIYSDGYAFWTMSPAGFSTFYSATVYMEDLNHAGDIGANSLSLSFISLRPVINLNDNVKALGTGTSTDPYVIQTN